MAESTKIQAKASKFEDLTKDYSNEPVPQGLNSSGLQVATILCAIGITLPVLSYSSWLAVDNGLGSANFAFWIGCWIVMGVSLFSGLVGARSRLSTYMILQFSFGRQGAKIVNLLMAIILLGWYAATCETFGIALSQFAKNLLHIEINTWIATIVGSFLMTITTIFGFQMIEKFSRLSVPLLVVFLIYVAFQATGGSTVPLDWSRHVSGDKEMSLISIIIGLFMLAAVLMPDFTRYCANDRQSHIASAIGVGVTFPVVSLLATIPAIRTGETDIVLIMASMGVVFSALFVLVFATWSTNITNLYSSTLTLSTFASKAPSWKVTVFASVVATIAAVLGMTSYFTAFLLFIGVATTPLVGVYVVDYFCIKKGNFSMERLAEVPVIGWQAIVAWIIGSVVGYLSENGYIALSGLSAIDALVVTSILYFILARKSNKSL
ncbi:MAG: purine-cytosine permease family protein [Marinomonadaceae bacterium]